MKTLSLWLVLFAVLLDWIGIGLVYPMFSAMLFHQEFLLVDPSTSENVRGWLLGILLSAMPIAQFLSGPILGSLSDQKGRRPLFLFSLVLGVVGYACSVLGVVKESITILLFSRLLVGAGAGNIAVISATVADLSTMENKAKHFGLYSMMCGIGFTAGPFFGGVLSEYGFAMPFLIAGITTLFNLLLIATCFQETYVVKKKSKIRFQESLLNLKKALQIRELRILFVAVALFCFGWSFFYEFIPVTWIAEYSFDARQIGLFFAYGAGFYAISAGLLIRPIVSAFSPHKILLWALFFLGMEIFAILWLQPPVWGLWIYLPFLNFTCSLIYPTYNTIVSNWAHKDSQGEMLGILQSVQAGAFAMSPLGAGFLLIGNPRMPLIVGGAILLLAAAILGSFLKRRKA